MSILKFIIRQTVLPLFCATPLFAQEPASTVVAATPVPGSLDSLVGQPVTHFNFLTLVVGYLAVTLIGLFGFLILWRIYTGKIDLSLLLSESGGGASLSRFQFLIFTFVISLSLLLVILGAKDGPHFPEKIPAGFYVLLGISAASYVASKGIQKNIDKRSGHNRVPREEKSDR